MILALGVAPIAWGAQPLVTGDISLSDARFACPLLGAEFQFATPWNPSIAQAVGLSAAFYEAAFFGIDRGVDWLGQRRRDSAGLSLAKDVTGAAFLALTSFMPLGLFWVHEEAHRAVLSHRGIASRDELDNFSISETYSAYPGTPSVPSLGVTSAGGTNFAAVLDQAGLGTDVGMSIIQGNYTQGPAGTLALDIMGLRKIKG